MIWWRLICGISAPFDLLDLLALVPRADLSLQDEMQVAFHPTLTRVWCRKGRRGQRLVQAPLDNRHPCMALGWWTGAMAGSMVGLQKARTADVFCERVRAATARSRAARTGCHRDRR